MAPLLQYSIMVLMALSLLAVTPAIQDDEASVQIVFLAKSHDSAASHLEILASVLGSESAAKKAILYDFTLVLNGFAAKLTVGQIQALLKSARKCWGLFVVTKKGEDISLQFHEILKLLWILNRGLADEES